MIENYPCSQTYHVCQQSKTCLDFFQTSSACYTISQTESKNCASSHTVTKLIKGKGIIHLISSQVSYSILYSSLSSRNYVKHIVVFPIASFNKWGSDRQSPCHPIHIETGPIWLLLWVVGPRKDRPISPFQVEKGHYLADQRSQIPSLGQLGNVSVTPPRSWWKWPGRGTSGSPSSNCCPRDPDPDKGQKTKQKQNIFVFKRGFQPRLLDNYFSVLKGIVCIMTQKVSNIT